MSPPVDPASLSPESILANVNWLPILLTSSKYIGSARTETTEMSFKLNSDNMLHAFVLIAELVKEISQSFD